MCAACCLLWNAKIRRKVDASPTHNNNTPSLILSLFLSLSFPDEEEQIYRQSEEKGQIPSVHIFPFV
jgi:hypothetical protein